MKKKNEAMRENLPSTTTAAVFYGYSKENHRICSSFLLAFPNTDN